MEHVASLDDPQSMSLGEVAGHQGATYHLEVDFSGQMSASYVVRIDRHGARTVVSDSFWAHEMEHHPERPGPWGCNRGERGP